MHKQIYLGKIDLLVHFLNSIFTQKVVPKRQNSLIAPFLVGPILLKLYVLLNRKLPRMDRMTTMKAKIFHGSLK